MTFDNDLLSVIRRVVSQETVFLKHFEGVVTDDQDPKSLGRVKVQIPELLWTTPDKTPWAGPEHALSTVVPPPGSPVVVYFLKGDRARPVYRGGSSERGASRLAEYKEPSTAVLYEDGEISVVWDRRRSLLAIKLGAATINLDAKGNLNVTADAKVVVDAPQVVVTGGQVKIDGSAVPTGRGAFCGLSNCAFSGAPHVGDVVNGS
jgi:phage gp45-like